MIQECNDTDREDEDCCLAKHGATDETDKETHGTDDCGVQVIPPTYLMSNCTCRYTITCCDEPTCHTNRCTDRVVKFPEIFRRKFPDIFEPHNPMYWWCWWWMMMTMTTMMMITNLRVATSFHFQAPKSRLNMQNLIRHIETTTEKNLKTVV